MLRRTLRHALEPALWLGTDLKARGNAELISASLSVYSPSFYRPEARQCSFFNI